MISHMKISNRTIQNTENPENSSSLSHLRATNLFHGAQKQNVSLSGGGKKIRNNMPRSQHASNSPLIYSPTVSRYEHVRESANWRGSFRVW